MSNDFDFLTGRWDVRNRRLATLFSGADDWYEFPAVSRAQQLLGGVGNLDEITFPTLDKIGMTLRLFDQERKEWSIYWSISSTGRLYPPMRGVFSGGRGTSTATTSTRGAPYGRTSSGRTCPRTVGAGSRSTRTTAAGPGSPTG
ncbi:hypothetical protein AB0M29_02010 [Streptomyces sp. NPDC051976]|uniref:hypothetical protein n=1 Tax=Streptomyces sp. NPDC051976 TaxID=3154947 RepID=UPI00343C6AC0